MTRKISMILALVLAVVMMALISVPSFAEETEEAGWIPEAVATEEPTGEEGEAEDDDDFAIFDDDDWGYADPELIAAHTPEMTQEFIHADDPDWVPEGENEAEIPEAENPGEEASEPETPTEENPAEENPAPAEDGTEKPADEEPAEGTSGAEAPAEETPAENNPADETPVQETPEEENPAVENPTEETPASNNPAEETHADENPTEEAPAPEESAPEAPAAETPAEETPAPEETAVDVPESDVPAEEIPEGGETPDETPADEAPEKSAVTVTIKTTMTGENEMKLNAVVNDPEGRAYSYQWQVSVDGGRTYEDIKDETADVMRVELTEENSGAMWRVRVQAI